MSQDADVLRELEELTGLVLTGAIDYEDFFVMVLTLLDAGSLSKGMTSTSAFREQGPLRAS